MTDAFRSKLQTKLSDYRSWSVGRRLSGCRLVQYCGVEMVGAQDVPLAEVESRIESLICRGFYVDWEQHQSRLFLRVWEFGGPEPEWAKVFAEQALIDIDDLLGEIEA